VARPAVRLSGLTDSAEVRGFYQFVADREKQHFDALNTLYSTIRADFWGMGGFAPF